MANNFQIRITAVDKATSVVRGIKAEFAAVASPVNDLFRSLNSLGRETGINKVVNGLQQGGRAALGMARSVAMLSAPIAALASAGIVAGVTALATGWGRAAQSLSNTSAVIGIGTTDLQRYRGAAQLAGLSASDMDGSLQSLGDTMQGAMFGRNPQALSLMNAYGMSIKRTKTGAIDTTAALMDLSKMIQTNMRSGGNIQSARLIAGAFGAENLLPMLIKGPEAIRANVEEMDRLNATMSPEQIAAGEQYARNLARMDFAVIGLKNSLGNALLPVLNDVVTSMTDWLANPDNKKKAIDTVSKAVDFLSSTLKDIDWDAAKKDAAEFFDAIKGGYDLLQKAVGLPGRVKDGFERGGNAMRGRGAVTNNELANSGASVPLYLQGWRDGNDKVTAQTKALFQGLEQRDHLPPGTLDSVWAEESSRGLHLIGPETRNGESALGHFQFMKDTAKQYGLTDPNDLEKSADAASRLMRDLLKQNNGSMPRALAAYNWGQGNLNKYGMDRAPAQTRNYVSEVTARIVDAQANGAGSNVAPLYPPKQPTSTADRDSRMAELQQQAGTVHVQIDMPNAPAGTRLNAQATGPVRSSTRIGYAMDASKG